MRRLPGRFEVSRHRPRRFLRKCLRLLTLALWIVLTSSFAPIALHAAPAEEAELEEASGPIVARIEWRGVRAVEESLLEDRIVTTADNPLDPRFWRPAPRVDPFSVEEDRERIALAYRDAGYFEAVVEAEIVPFDRGGLAILQREARVVVVFTIEEGDPTALARWTIEIVDDPDEPDPLTSNERARLEAIGRVTDDSTFGARLYRERKRSLLDAAAELGFPEARIDGGADVDTEANEASVAWRVQLGPRSSVGAISISGLDRIAPEIVRRELAFGSGDRVRPSTIEESERRLIATGLFRTVAIGRPTGGVGEIRERGTIPIEVRIEEAPPRSFRASIGYGAEDGVRGDISLDWRNFLGDARRLRLRAFGSFLDVGFEGDLGQPYLFGPASRGDLSVSALRQERPGYEAFVTGAAGIVTLRPARESPWHLSVGPGYELSEILDFQSTANTDIRGPKDSTIVNLFVSLGFDDVDDALDPTRGVRMDLAAEFGGYPIGSDLDFHRWSLDARTYLGNRHVVWATRAAYTTLDPIAGGREDVPLTRRLYSGGTTSVRGFGFQRLGPEDTNNDPLGGLSRIELGTELRFRVWSPLSIVGFLDAGDVRARPFRLSPSELRASAGPGLRLDTPVGPLRLDVGFLLNPPRDSDPWRIHLSVGHAF